MPGRSLYALLTPYDSYGRFADNPSHVIYRIFSPTCRWCRSHETNFRRVDEVISPNIRLHRESSPQGGTAQSPKGGTTGSRRNSQMRKTWIRSAVVAWPPSIIKVPWTPDKGAMDS